MRPRFPCFLVFLFYLSSTLVPWAGSLSLRTQIIGSQVCLGSFQPSFLGEERGGESPLVMRIEMILYGAVCWGESLPSEVSVVG
jgi:hypothetical protein